ncbi:MAG: hypothetical protein IPH18_07430 [Chitinophagaceae bacterium]|nr:hypothetical protein [Chitinophagaceae bacterium]
MDPENIHLGVDIRNPDLIIDNIIEHLNNKGVDSSWLFTVRDFNHDEKIKWILSLPDADSIVAEGSFNFPVTIYNRFMLKVAETVGGESLYEKKEVERIIEKCMPD